MSNTFNMEESVPASFPSYVDIDEAQTYFDARLNTDPWDEAEAATRQKAVSHAARLIDRLAFKGDKTADDQTLEFPRNGDSEVPQDIKNACCELALVLLDDVD